MQSVRLGRLRWLRSAQILALTAAVATAAGHLAQSRTAGPSCRTATVADSADVSQLLVSTVPTSEGVRLERMRTSAIGTTGMYYLGASVVDGTRRPLGIGVWRVVRARNTAGLPADVEAANPVAEMLTPDLSRLVFAGSGGPPECLLTQ